MQQGKRILYNIFREVEERYQKIEKLSDFNSSKSKKTIEDYLNAAAKTSEFLLHFIATFEASIITKFNQNNDTFDDSKFIKYFINRKHQILNNRRFMVNLENFYLTLVQDSGKEKEILERFREKMNKGGKLTRIRGLRNIQAHGPLNICMNDIRESFGIHSAENRSQEELLRITYNTLMGVKKDITDLCEEKQLDILEWASFTGYVPGNNELRTNKNRTMILDPEDEMLYIYKDLYIEQKNNKKEIKLRYDSVLDPLIIEDTQGFKALKDAYMYIEEDNQKQNTKGLYLKGEERIYKTDIYLNNLQKKHLLQLTIYTAGEQRKTESYPLKQEEFQEIALDLKILTDELNEGEHDLHLYIVEQNKPEEKITSENKKFQIEERKEGTIEVGIPFALGSESEETHSKAVQNKLYEITLPLENMGNIPRKVKITMAIKDKDHFTLHRTYEEYPEEKTQEKEVRLKGYEKKEITIELLPTRSEHEKYNIGKIIVEDLENGKREERELGSVEIIKIYEPVNFYNRTVLLTEMEEYYKEDQKVEKPDINRIWIRGEAGQGKSRLSQEIAERAKKENCTCISITKTEESAIYEETRMALNKQIQQYHKNSTLEFHKKESPRDEFGKPKPINWAQEIFTMLDQYEADIHTQNTIIYQIDDIHLLNEEFLKKINEEIEMRNRFNKETRKQIRMSVVLYSRTAAGLGHNVDETKEKEMQAILRDWEVKVLKKINPEDIEKIDIANEEDMIKDIMLEIFGPNGFKLEETDCLKKIIGIKSEANPLIVQLLLEELERNAKMIKWDQENGLWEINWEKIEIDESLSYETEEEFQSLRLKSFEHKLNELYPTEKLEERLILEKLDQFKGTDAEMIMNLVGMLDGVDEKELEAQNLNVKNYPGLMGILKVEKEHWQDKETEGIYPVDVYRFKHHLYEEYWERYFEEEIRPLFETWNAFREKLTKREVKSEEIEKWLQETRKLIEKRIASGIAEDESNLDEDDFDHEEYIDLKKTYEETVIEINSEKTITYKTLSENFFKKFKTQDDLLKYMMIREQLLNGFDRRGEIDDSYTIRYGLYRYLAEKESFEEIEAYYDRFVKSVAGDIHQHKYNEKFENDLRFLMEKVLVEFEEETVDNYWVALTYTYLADIKEIKGNYAEAINFYIQSTDTIKKYLTNYCDKSNAYSLLGSINTGRGNILAINGKLVEAIRVYNDAINAHWKAITLTPEEAKYYSNLGITIQKKGDILAGKGRFKEALAIYEEAVEKYAKAIAINQNCSGYYSNQGVAIQSKGDILANNGKLDEAINLFKEAAERYDSAIALDPYYSNYHSNKGIVIWKTGDVFAGMGILEEALNMYTLAVLELDIALTLNSKVAGCFSNSGAIFWSQGNILSEMGKQEEALSAYTIALQNFDRAIILNPNRADFYSGMGSTLNSKAKIFSEMGKQEESLSLYTLAIQNFEKAISLNPNNADYYSSMGNSLNCKGKLLEEIGRDKEAMNVYVYSIQKLDRAIILNPKSSGYHSNKGIAIAGKVNIFQKNGELKKALSNFALAIQSFERAITLNPNKADYHSNKGIALQRKATFFFCIGKGEEALGLYTLAIQSFERAIALNPKKCDYFMVKEYLLNEIKKFSS